MPITLSNLMLSLVPEDGSSIGNVALLALLRKQMPDMDEGDYTAARNELINEGLLAKRRGRGGAVCRTEIAELELSPKPDHQ